MISPDYTNEEVSQHLFNQGLLLAARAAGAPTEFVTEGPKWDAAFGAVVNHLSDDHRVHAWLKFCYRDPMFGNWPAASELILQGEHDLLLALLSPTLGRAAFLLKKEQAAQELEEFPYREWFQSVGEIFAKALHGTTVAPVIGSTPTYNS